MSIYRVLRIVLIALALVVLMRLIAEARDYPNRDPSYQTYIWPERQRYWDHLETLDAIDQAQRDTESYLYDQEQQRNNYGYDLDYDDE